MSQDRKKLDIIKEHFDRGGMPGYAMRILKTEIEQAINGTSEILGDYVSAVKRGDPAQAAEELINCLRTAANSKSSKIHMSGFFYTQFLFSKFLLKQAEKNFDDESFLKSLPLTIVRWAGVGVGIRWTKVSSGSKKGEKNRFIVEEKYKKYRPKISNTAILAEKIQKEMLREMGLETGDLPNGNKDREVPVPALKTVMLQIRKLNKKNGY